MRSAVTYEHEYRRVLACPFPEARDAVEALAETEGEAVERYSVVYAGKHFRFRRTGGWEVKRTLSHRAVYFDGFWFRFVESREIPFHSWCRTTHVEFVNAVGFYQDPFRVEDRLEVSLGGGARLYAFRRGEDSGVVFELETYAGRKREAVRPDAATSLPPFQYAYARLHGRLPSRRLTACVRKPVVPVPRVDEDDPRFLVARKHDGVFGFVYSHADRIVEMWEDNRRAVLEGVTLGSGVVYGAERMSDDDVVLLDVYQVRGSPVSCCARRVLTEYLPGLTLPSARYRVQTYRDRAEELPPVAAEGREDGLIYHDTVDDRVYKVKTAHTVDLLYESGSFVFPDGEMGDRFGVRDARQKGLRDGAVYECTVDGRGRCVPLREREDRFTGNTAEQMENILKCMRECLSID